MTLCKNQKNSVLEKMFKSGEIWLNRSLPLQGFVKDLPKVIQFFGTSVFLLTNLTVLLKYFILFHK